jgi:two-component system chemotaxis sensor kinase CheA
MDDLLSEFLTETAESLAVLDVELVKLEQNPNDPELISNIFRLVHTIKGTCGFLGLPRLESVAHAGENVLGKLRDGEIEVSPTAVSLILACLDCVRSLLSSLEQNEAEPEGNDQDLIDRLNAFADSDGAEAAVAATDEEPVMEEPVAEEPVVEEKPAAKPAAKPTAKPTGNPAAAKPAVVGSVYERLGGLSVIDAVVEVAYQHIMEDEALKGLFQNANMDVLQGKQRAFFSKILGGPDEFKGDIGGGKDQPLAAGMTESHFAGYKSHLQVGLKTLEVPADVATDVMARLDDYRDLVIGRSGEEADEADDEAPVAVKSAKPAKAKGEAKAAAPAKAQEAGEPKESAVANQSIRVNVDLLENLMTMVSELVLTRNQVLQILRTQKDSEFAAPLQRLNHITSELQEGVMKTRMQPIGNAWSKLPRIIRDLAHELDKKIDLQMIGADTELDRQVLEMIKDPLTHMVRNSADHGLETAAERRRAGKPETGKVTLNAYHEGGHIIIEIADDGRGLPIDKIKKKALQNGLATENELEQMSVQQIQQFIFKAGFSTAAKVTNVSGRGVGMDVVRTNIEKIGGTVELRSTEGKGSTFVIKIPLTLAIVSALIVECAGERFAVPQISVVELVRVSANSEHKIERIKDAPVLRLRNRLLPLVSLRTLLRLKNNDGRSEEQESSDSFVVVSQVGTYTVGIMVDRVFDTEEIVVKPVAPILRDIAMFSGNTILGDGSVIMILDPNGIAAASGEMNMAESEGAEKAGHRDARAGERVPLLLFRAGDETPKAVPLGLVARLEEVDVKSVELSNGQLVVQYRGQLMPLVPLDPGYKMRESGRQPVLVFSDRDRSMGLIVDEIVDIVEDRLQVELSSERVGRIGSAIVAGHATDLVDAGYYLTQAFQDWFKSDGPAEGGEGQPKRVLLVDDSPFFRNLLAPLLSVAGYEVTTAENADKAMGFYEAGEDFDVIISDIEMPGMNGFQFAEAVKNSIRWQKTPIVALSSHASAKDLDRGRAVGFDDYVAKFDRDALLQTLHDTLSDMRGAA